MSGAETRSVLRKATRRAYKGGLLGWALALLLLLVFGIGWLKPLFTALFPGLERPLYEQDTFLGLMLAHLKIVGISSGVSVIVGVTA
ncbi:MAG: ABC transporter permease, partial [Polaromonas sp.]